MKFTIPFSKVSINIVNTGVHIKSWTLHGKNQNVLDTTKTDITKRKKKHNLNFAIFKHISLD